MLKMMLVLLPNIRSSCILTLFNQVDHDIDENIIPLVTVFLLFTGLFISIIGVRKISSCIFLLLVIAIEVMFKKMRIYIEKAANNSDTPDKELLKRVLIRINEVIGDNNIKIAIGMLIVCVLGAYLITSLFKAASTFGFLLVVFFAYSEIFDKEASLRFGVQNQYVLWGLFILFSVAVCFVFRKLPYIVLCVFFGIIGPLISIYAIELLFKVDVGFNRLRKIPEESNIDSTNIYHALGFIVICVLVSLYQVYYVLRKK